MPSYSYKMFLIMDQLRRRAGISVPQLLHVLDIDISTYSRISFKVYAEDQGVLHYDIEQKVRCGLDVLTSGYTQKLLSPTTLKKKDDVIAVLQHLESQLVANELVMLIDCEMDQLLGEANNLLST